MAEKSPRIPGYDYGLPNYYFVTICTHDKKCLFGKPGILNRFGQFAEECLKGIPNIYPEILLDKYVIMPTHIHAIVRLDEGIMPRQGLTEIVGAYKSLTTRAINLVQNTPGIKQFQRSFYEAVIRSETAYQSCWKYIDGNPDQWVLQNEKEWEFHYVDEDTGEMI